MSLTTVLEKYSCNIRILTSLVVFCNNITIPMFNLFKKSSEATLEDAVYEFLDSEITPNQKISEYTKQDIKSSLLWILRRNYKQSVKDIDYEWFCVFKKELAESNYTAGSARKYYNHIKRVVTWWRAKNNLRAVIFPKLDNIKQKIKEDKSADQLAQLYRIIKTLSLDIENKPEGILSGHMIINIRLYFTLRFLFETGIRIQEFNQVRFCDINFKTKELTIPQYLNSINKGVGRTIAISSETLKLVKTFRDSESKIDFLNPYKFGTKDMYIAKRINVDLRAYCKRVGIKNCLFTVSDIRKIYTSVAAANQVDLTFLASHLGHSSCSTTYRYYSKSSIVLKSKKGRRKIRQLLC